MSDANSKNDEYLDLSSNMRFYANIRFAQLTLFAAVTAALLTVAYGQESPPAARAFCFIKVGGILASVIFFIMEERGTSYYFHFKQRAIELEKLLGYGQYTNIPKRGVWTATNAARGFIIAVGLFWLVGLLFPSLFPPT